MLAAMHEQLVGDMQDVPIIDAWVMDRERCPLSTAEVRRLATLHDIPACGPQPAVDMVKLIETPATRILGFKVLKGCIANEEWGNIFELLDRDLAVHSGETTDARRHPNVLHVYDNIYGAGAPPNYADAQHVEIKSHLEGFGCVSGKHSRQRYGNSASIGKNQLNAFGKTTDPFRRIDRLHFLSIDPKTFSVTRWTTSNMAAMAALSWSESTMRTLPGRAHVTGGISGHTRTEVEARALRDLHRGLGFTATHVCTMYINDGATTAPDTTLVL